MFHIWLPSFVPLRGCSLHPSKSFECLLRQVYKDTRRPVIRVNSHRWCQRRFADRNYLEKIT